MDEIGVLLEGGLNASPEARVMAVCDHFGRTFHVFSALHQAGQILKKKVNHLYSDRGTVDSRKSTIHLRVLSAPVHHNTVRALLRRAPEYSFRKLYPGVWHEVLCD